MAEQTDVKQESSLAAVLDGKSESSTDAEVEQQPVSSEATEKKAETKEPPFHEHPRWKEVMDEKKRAQEKADRLEQQLLEISGRLSTPKVDEEDPYKGLEGDVKEWARFIDQRGERLTNKAKKEIMQEIQKMLQTEVRPLKEYAVRSEYEKFRAKHPDVIPNSPEEIEIAKKVSMGYLVDDAYDVVVGATKRKALEEELAKIKAEKQKVVTKQKLAANMETGGLSAGSPIHPKEKMDIRSFVDNYLSQQAAG